MSIQNVLNRAGQIFQKTGETVRSFSPTLVKTALVASFILGVKALICNERPVIELEEGPKMQLEFSDFWTCLEEQCEITFDFSMRPDGLLAAKIAKKLFDNYCGCILKKGLVESCMAFEYAPAKLYLVKFFQAFQGNY